MNIENFKPKYYSLKEIFQKQKEIKFLYEPGAKEIFEFFDIDTYEDQETFKRYCWRITEELMEALEDRRNIKHFQEELIDGYNFLIELYLLYGWTEEDMDKTPIEWRQYETIESVILEIIYQIGITANLLKNREWRRSEYLVDLYLFEPRFKKIWYNYMKLFDLLGMDEKKVSELWSLKYQVNLFRIRTNY